MGKINKKVLIGFIIAPIVAIVVLTILEDISWGVFQRFYRVMLFIAFLYTLVFAIPTYHFLKYKQLNKLHHYSIATIIGIFIPWMIFFIFGPKADEFSYGDKILVRDRMLTLDGYIHYSIYTLKITVSGLVGTFVFWLIAIHHKIDRD